MSNKFGVCIKPQKKLNLQHHKTGKLYAALQPQKMKKLNIGGLI